MTIRGLEWSGRKQKLCFRLRYHGRGRNIKHHIEGERWYARLQSVGERWCINPYSVGKEWYAQTHPAMDLTGATMKGMRQAKESLGGAMGSQGVESV